MNSFGFVKLKFKREVVMLGNYEFIFDLSPSFLLHPNTSSKQHSSPIRIQYTVKKYDIHPWTMVHTYMHDA